MNGSVHVYVPRSFRGPITLTTRNGAIKLSSAVRTQVQVFSDIKGVQRGFLGPFDPAEWKDSDHWTGDEITAETMNGHVKVFFDDEATTGWGKPKSPNFFERLFSSLV